MKRNVYLQPLSRQHHNGLLMALLLQKGVKKKASHTVLCDFIRYGWEEELEHHFASEELVLIPAAFKKKINPALTEQLLHEHTALRLLVQKASTHSATEKDIIDFASLLEKHIRFEERTYFPEAEKLLSEKELKEMGDLLQEDITKNCINYPVKFWE